MDIVFLRHGETNWNLSRRVQGTKPVGLNSTGRSQIRKTCQDFKHKSSFGFSLIVSSPLVRALQSAVICGSILQLPVCTIDMFRERSFGVLEGKTHAQIQSEYQIEDIERVESSVYGIEPITTLDERLTLGLQILKTTYGSEQILVVTHGSVIRRLSQKVGKDERIIANGSFVQLSV